MLSYSNLAPTSHTSDLNMDKLIKFVRESLNTFLETMVVLEQGEHYTTYSRFCHTHPDPQKLASKLCIPR